MFLEYMTFAGDSKLGYGNKGSRVSYLMGQQQWSCWVQNPWYVLSQRQRTSCLGMLRRQGTDYFGLTLT